MARIIEVIQTEHCIGKGTEDSPNRTLIQYWFKDGRLLCEIDPVRSYDGKTLGPDPWSPDPWNPPSK